MNLTQQSNSQSSQQNAKRSLVNKEAALWKGICIQFKDACKLELLGNKDEAQLWLKKKVSPFINMWSKESQLPVEEKKKRLRAQMTSIRKEAEMEWKAGSLNQQVETTAQIPFKHPDVVAKKTTPKKTSPYLASYKQSTQGRVSKPRLPLSEISAMIDAVQADSETTDTEES